MINGWQARPARTDPAPMEARQAEQEAGICLTETTNSTGANPDTNRVLRRRTEAVLARGPRFKCRLDCFMHGSE